MAQEIEPLLNDGVKPQLLSGDLWTVNTIMDSCSLKPTITGIFDCDRAWFGDPLADWPVRMAYAKKDERLAFWEAYGSFAESPENTLKKTIYEARHLGGIQLERYRLNNPTGVTAIYEDIDNIVKKLATIT